MMMTCLHGRSSRTIRLAFVLSLLGLNPSVASAQSCTQTLSPGANVAAAVSGATAGSTICVNSGNYGTATFSGVVKNPRVTIRSTTGRGASIGLIFQNGTNGITIDSLTVPGAKLVGSTTRNITVQNSTFTGATVFDGLVNSNVLFTNNTHNNIEWNQGGGVTIAAGRLQIDPMNPTHTGITIQNSLLDGGSADGVNASTGVNIINNEFRNIREGSCGSCHTDAIQLFGAAGSVIRGNYIHDVATGIVAYDGVTRVTIEDNVVDTGSRPAGIELYSDADSIVRHNTLLFRANCLGNQSCGEISLDHKSADPAGRGTIVVDNIATSISAVNGSTYAQRHHNLVRSGAATGDFSGSPTYLQGATPTTWAGFQLSAASAGKGAASSPQGSDVGATIGAIPPIPPVPAPPAPVPPPAPTNLRILR